MVKTGQNLNLSKVDFSFIPSLRCNIRCPFCMYDASPDNDGELDFERTRLWLETVDREKVGSWGFYGGEPSINLPLYERFMNLIPSSVPKFVITNGAWSSSNHAWLEWWDFCNKRVQVRDDDLRIVISGTPEHRKFQRTSLMEQVAGWAGVIVKGDDDIHPMGRARRDTWACTGKCTWHEQPIRLALFPGGHVILQNCDGVYPVIGNYEEPFDKLHEIAIEVRTHGCGFHTNLNDIIYKERS